MQLYYNPHIQGWYASRFPSGGQGFLQPRGDIHELIIPRGFRALPADGDADNNQEMSTDTEAAVT